MRKFALTAALLASGLASTVLVGCGPNCQSTCQRIYGDGIQDVGADCAIPGRTSTDLINTCMQECEDALDTPGEIGSYNPIVQQGAQTSVELENERQAALWMECVGEKSCGNLEEGYCAPIW